MSMNRYYCFCESPVGRVTLVAEEGRLSWLALASQRFLPSLSGMTRQDDVSVFVQTKAWLAGYFAGRQPSVEGIPLALSGTPFRLRVWELLRGIPYGTTVTYGELARELQKQSGGRVAAQAVGNAVGHNPVSLIVPCHRVIGADGSLVGYGGGLSVKERLLALEAGRHVVWQ